MLGGVTKLDASHQLTCPLRLEDFVEGSFGVGVELVANKNNFLAVGLTPLQ
jgi:hypothetical protein